MLAAIEVSPLARLIAIGIASLLALVAPRGGKLMAFVGCLAVFIGLGYFAMGRIPQRWGGGPPLGGSLALFGAAVIAASGVCIVVLAFVKKSDDHTKESDDHQ